MDNLYLASEFTNIVRQRKSFRLYFSVIRAGSRGTFVLCTASSRCERTAGPGAAMCFRFLLKFRSCNVIATWLRTRKYTRSWSRSQAVRFQPAPPSQFGSNFVPGTTVAAPPVRLVRLWPDHFSSRPITQTRQWHLFLVLVLGLPLILHTSQGLFLPKTAVRMLRERFLTAKNTCEFFFPRFARTDRRFVPLQTQRAPPGTAFGGRYDCGGRTTLSMPLPPLNNCTPHCYCYVRFSQCIRQLLVTAASKRLKV